MSNVQQEICPFCGKVTRTDGNFCTECGHKIEGIFNSQTAYRAKINTKENERDEEVENLKATFNRIESYKGEYKEINSYGRKEGKKRIYIVVSLLAIFVIVFIVIKLNVSSPKKVAEKYIKALESKYMQKNNLVLNMNYVFYNPKVKKIKYIYLPLIQIEKKDETLDFLRNLPYYVVFTRSENADYVTKYLSYFKEKINFSMYEFKELIKKISSTEKKERVQEYGNIKEKKLKFAQLLDMDTGEKIDIVSQKYVIGKNEDCDLVVNSTHISRHHAYISYVDGIYYLVDMGSTNHTYIDGEELERGIPVELHNGMQVKFADKMYKFYLTVKGAAD